MRTLVLDLETERDFKAVGGKQNLHLLGVTVVGVYDYTTNVYHAYEKEEFEALETILKEAQLLIGFNINHFDLPVLAPHIQYSTATITTLDIMQDIEKVLGFRVSLDNASRATLGVGKSGMGLEAIEWWAKGEKEKVKEYCLQDVRLTRDLYEFGRKEGFILIDSRDRGRVRVPVAWRNITPSLKKVLGDALEKRTAVELEYIVEERGIPTHQKRKVDVYAIREDAIEGFCHLFQVKKIFHLDKIAGVALTNESYQLHQDVQQSLI